MTIKRNKDDKKASVNIFVKYSSLAFEMLGIIAFGSWLGHFIDKYRQGEVPVFTIIFSLLSVFASLYLVFKSIIKPK